MEPAPALGFEGFLSDTIYAQNAMKKNLVSRFVVVLLAVYAAAISLTGSAAGGKCSWRVEIRDGRRVAVAAAQPLHQNGKLEFGFLPGSSVWNLEVRFKPGGKFKPRLTSTDILKILNGPEASAYADIDGIGGGPPPLERLVEWKFVQGTYLGEYALPNAVISRMGRGWFGFDTDLANAIRDVNPAGSVATDHCGSLIQSLKRQ